MSNAPRQFESVRVGLNPLKEVFETLPPFTKYDHRSTQYQVYKDDEFICEGWYFAYKNDDRDQFRYWSQELIRHGYEVVQWKEPYREKSDACHQDQEKEEVTWNCPRS